MKIRIVFLLLSVLLTAVAVLPAAEVPYLSGRVNDYAQILSPETFSALTERLKAHEERTGDQIVALTIPTIDGESIEDFATRVFDDWKLGQKEKDNGILILVVPNDRKMRIEVGYGLEGTLTDGTAGQIIRTIMTPKFRAGDYNGGIMDGSLAVIKVLESGTLPEPVAAGSSGSGDSNIFEFNGPDLPILPRILIGVFIFSIIGLFTFMGIVTPGMGWFLYFFLIPFWAMFPTIVLGTRGAIILLVLYIIGFPIAKIFLKKTEWYKKARKSMRTKGKASIGGFTFSSGGSSRSWSSGSSGGSSFSGGGGSSGGGGASGSW